MTKQSYNYDPQNGYMSLEDRKSGILTAALGAASVTPYYEIRRHDIASWANVAPSAINQCFGTMEGMRQAILAEAIKTENVNVLKYALTRNEPLIEKMPKLLKQKVAASLIK